ncbi:MAG: GDP-mannose 4,6-dehydratase [Eubacterium sp.]|nr:GDP-mannose 4,6-dehydratase [Eubacterium sp.]
MKRALITGITGQDGSYLAELLLEKGYQVYGIMRRKSVVDYGNAVHSKDKIHFIYADMTDLASLVSAMKTAQPDEVYNLAAQSFVGTSWEQPFATADIDAIGVMNMLEAVRLVKPEAHFYQAATSEMFGKVQEMPQTEQTPFYPRSPYGVAKLYGYWITRNYRESFGMFACSGILFNHESERRGLEFVTRKITHAAARIRYGLQDCLELGNLDSRRDWGHAQDYVRAMWMLLQNSEAKDYVIASNETRTVREFAGLAFRHAGMELEWEGTGVHETGKDRATGRVLVRVNPEFFRPAEVEVLWGNPAKAEKELGWKRSVSFEELVGRMVDNDLKLVEQGMGRTYGQ